MTNKAATLWLSLLALCAWTALGACTTKVGSDQSGNMTTPMGMQQPTAGVHAGAAAGAAAAAMSGAAGTAAVNAMTSSGGAAGDVGIAGTGSMAGTGDMAGVGGAAAAAGDSAIPGTGDEGSAAPELAITADFLNGTLSVIDVSLLRDGGTRADALVGTVDLSMYAPGPMSLAITPDGKTCVVSISSGFLGAFITVPAGAGTLVFVDIETRTVTGELNVGDSPMGIVFSRDSKRAFVGLYGESYFAVVDMETRTYEPVNTGSGYNEELSIDDSGTVGILTYGPSGNVKTFSVDPPGQIGQTTGLTGDAAGVAFFPGTKKAYLMQAPTILTGNVGGHDIIDVTDPERPVASDNVRVGTHPTTYPVTAVAARGSVAFPSTQDNMVSVVEMTLTGDTAQEAGRVVVGAAASLAYGLTATRDGRVLIAVPGEHYVGVVDLEAGTAFMVPWEVTMTGPTEIKVVP